MSSQVPYTGVPSVQPSFDATPSVSSNIPMDAFGAGVANAVGHIGRAVEGAGNEIWARATAMQQLNEQANAANAVAEFTTAMGEKYAAYSSLSGKAAVDGYKPYIEDLNSTREAIGQKLNSPYAQKVYLQESRSIQARSVFSAAAHSGREGKNYAIGSTQSLIDARSNAAALAPQDEDSYKASLQQNAKDAQRLGDLHGWDAQTTKNYESQMNSKMTMGRIQGLAKQDVPAAQKLLDAAVKAGNITGDDLGRAQTYIRGQRLSVATRQEAARAVAGDNISFGAQKIPIDQLVSAVGDIEANDYGTLHRNVTHEVNGKTITEHALGKYGIMQSNLQPWLKEAGMPAMTEQEFLNNPRAQDQLAKFKLNQYQEKYGSANEALKRWRGLADKDLASGETSNTYLRKANAAMFRNASADQIANAGRARSKELFGDDAEAADAMEQSFMTRHSRQKAIDREDMQDNIDTIENAIVPAKDGKLVTSIEDIQDPKVQAAWDALPIRMQNRYRQLLSRNAKNDYTETPENQNEYRKWLGRLTDPMASPEERRDAMNQEFAFMNLPANQRQQLNMLKRAMWKSDNKAQNPALNHAMSVSNDILRQAGIDRSKTKDDYDLIRGTMFTILNDRMNAGDPVKKDEEIRQITSGLVRQINQTKIWGTLWGGTQAFKVEVPKDDRQKIIEGYMQKYDREPKDKEIQEIYNVKMYNQLYNKAKKMQSDKNAGMGPTSSMAPQVPRSQ